MIRANQAPKTTDDNKIPMKLREYLELNEKLKDTNKKFSKKNKKSDSKAKKNALSEVLNKKPDERGANVPLRPVNKFIKSKNESELQFLNRIEKVH